MKWNFVYLYFVFNANSQILAYSSLKYLLKTLQQISVCHYEHLHLAHIRLKWFHTGAGLHKLLFWPCEDSQMRVSHAQCVRIESPDFPICAPLSHSLACCPSLSVGYPPLSPTTVEIVSFCKLNVDSLLHKSLWSEVRDVRAEVFFVCVNI